MDYFAGSGTVGHACIDLNNEDGGNRTFILVGNNESNIFQDVTIPRLKYTLNKYTVNTIVEKCLKGLQMAKSGKY